MTITLLGSNVSIVYFMLCGTRYRPEGRSSNNHSFQIIKLYTTQDTRKSWHLSMDPHINTIAIQRLQKKIRGELLDMKIYLIQFAHSNVFDDLGSKQRYIDVYTNTASKYMDSILTCKTLEKLQILQLYATELGQRIEAESLKIQLINKLAHDLCVIDLNIKALPIKMTKDIIRILPLTNGCDGTIPVPTDVQKQKKIESLRTLNAFALKQLDQCVKTILQHDPQQPLSTGSIRMNPSIASVQHSNTSGRKNDSFRLT